jgi:hypothetical protein
LAGEALAGEAGTVESSHQVSRGQVRVTAFRFLLNAEPSLRAAALDWMRDRLGPEGLLIVNFHRNPRSLRGSYLRLRRSPGVAMMGVGEACALLARHGLTVRQVRGYSYLPYRRDCARLVLPGGCAALSRVGSLGSIGLPEWGGCFLLLAERSRDKPSAGTPSES